MFVEDFLRQFLTEIRVDHSAYLNCGVILFQQYNA